MTNGTPEWVLKAPWWAGALYSLVMRIGVPAAIGVIVVGLYIQRIDGEYRTAQKAMQIDITAIALGMKDHNLEALAFSKAHNDLLRFNGTVLIAQCLNQPNLTREERDRCLGLDPKLNRMVREVQR